MIATEETKLTDGDAKQETAQASQHDSTVAHTELNSAAGSLSPAPAATATVASSTLSDSPAPNTNEINDDEAQATSDVDFGAILDQYEREQEAFQEGAMVVGKVIDINDRGVLIDFGFKSEGVAAIEDFTENGEVTVKRGDEVEIVIKSMESQEGLPQLSRADARRARAWDDLEKAYQEGRTVKGRVAETIKGGLRVDINGVSAFLPGSQVDSRPIRHLDSFRGQEIEAKVIKLNRKRSNVVLSRKDVLDEQNKSRKEETLENLEEGVIVEGQIKSLTEYGAFVDLGGLDGLLHVTDMSWGRLMNPNEMFKTNDMVQVKVLRFDRNKERVSLGYKQLLPDPWESVGERFPIGTRMQGKVASVTDYGAFIEIEPGIEGLVHVTEMSWSKRMKHPNKLVNPGDNVDVQVLGVDPKGRRVSLGMKQVQPDPWETLPERYNIGSRVHGRVRNLTDFGAFVEIEDGVDGLVHVSDISWTKRIKHPGEALKKGQEIDAVITNIDTVNRRLSLSIKDIEPSAWDKFITEHKPGDVVTGKITRFANFGAFVELADGLEGLCHVSELTDDRVEKPEDAVKVGDELQFRILRVESDAKKIGLSARAAKHPEESPVDTKTYSSQVGSGMASLGELADFKFGGSKEEK